METTFYTDCEVLLSSSDINNMIMNNHALTHLECEVADFMNSLFRQHCNVTTPVSSPPQATRTPTAVKRTRESRVVKRNSNSMQLDVVRADVQKVPEQLQQRQLQNEEDHDEKGKRYGCQCAIRFQYEIQVSSQMKFVSCLKCLRARAQFYLGPRYYARGIKMRVKPDQMKQGKRCNIVWGDMIHKYHLQNVFQCIEKHFVVKIPASVNNLHDTLLFLGDKFPCTFEDLLKISHVPIIACDSRNKICELPKLVKEEVEEDDDDDIEEIEPERKLSRIGVHII